MSLANSLEIEEIINKNNPHSSSFILRHLPLGMGIKLGNYLRGVLLAYISGIAALGVKITDKNGPVKSKFSVLSGVVETTPYLILNLKNIILKEKNSKEEVFCLELKIENKKNEEKIITAGDFQKNKNVEIKNPELYLATLAPSSSLEIKLYCQKGVGYHSADEIDEQREAYFGKEEYVIALDPNYSPIKRGRVSFENFEVKTVVVGLAKEEEELKINISTNGAIEPREAFQRSLELSQDLFTSIAQLNNSRKEKVSKSRDHASPAA